MNKIFGTIAMAAVIAITIASANIYVGKAFAQTDTSTDNSGGGGSTDNSGGGGGGSTDNSGSSSSNTNKPPSTDTSQQTQQQPTQTQQKQGQEAIHNVCVLAGHALLPSGLGVFSDPACKLFGLQAHVVKGHHHN